MSIQLIDVGNYPNSGSGDPLRTAFEKVNDNFSQLSPIAFSGNYSSLFGSPVLAKVATTGQYSDLLGLPVFGALAFLSSIGNANWLGSPLSIFNGGTGQTTAVAAFEALSPISAQGDLIIGNFQGQPSRLGLGSPGQVLTVASNSEPAWIDGTGPGGVSSQLQFNSFGSFGGASALVYQTAGNFLTVSSLATTGTPINIVGFTGQTADLLDITAAAGSQGALAKFVANGGLYIQGAQTAPTSIELDTNYVRSEFFQLKFANGQYGPLLTVPSNNQSNNTSNGTSVEIFNNYITNVAISYVGWGHDCQLWRDSPDCFHHRRENNPCRISCFNWYKDENHWEGCHLADWQTETNVCRIGTHCAGSGVPREVHFCTGGNVACKIDVNQNLICNTGVLQSSATDGYWHIPQQNGAPTSTPTFFTGASPICVDAVNNKLRCNINGSWHYVALTAGT
jgi:hypothetical protein